MRMYCVTLGGVFYPWRLAAAFFCLLTYLLTYFTYLLTFFILHFTYLFTVLHSLLTYLFTCLLTHWSYFCLITFFLPGANVTLTRGRAFLLGVVMGMIEVLLLVIEPLSLDQYGVS